MLGAIADERGITLMELLQEAGFDGIIDGDYYIVPDSAQFKSATDNIGTFSRDDPDMRYSLSSDATSQVYDADTMLAGAGASMALTGAERVGLEAYKKQYAKYTELLKQMEEQQAILDEGEEKHTVDELLAARNRLAILRDQSERAYASMRKSSENGGMKLLRQRVDKVMDQYIKGKSEEQVQNILDRLEQEAHGLQAELDEAIKSLNAGDRHANITQVVGQFDQNALNSVARGLKAATETSLTQTELKNRVAMVLAYASSESMEPTTMMAMVSQLAEDLVPVTKYSERQEDGRWEMINDPQMREAYNADVAFNMSALMQAISANREALKTAGVSRDLLTRYDSVLEKYRKASEKSRDTMERSREALADIEQAVKTIWHHNAMTSELMKTVVAVKEALKTEPDAEGERRRMRKAR